MPKNSEKQKPVIKFDVGRIHASVWERYKTLENGTSIVQYSVTIQKSIKDKETGNWKNTTTFFPEDLPKLILAAQKAYEYVSCETKTAT